VILVNTGLVTSRIYCWTSTKFYPYFIHLFFDFGEIRYTKAQKKILNVASFAIVGAGKAIISYERK
jgi:hypothetical protein